MARQSLGLGILSLVSHLISLLTRMLPRYRLLFQRSLMLSFKLKAVPENLFPFHFPLQEKMFKVAGVPMVENVVAGYNSCMFAYGQVSFTFFL